MTNRLKAYYNELTYRLLRNKWTRYARNSTFLCDVLMFHHISDTSIDIDPSCQSTVAQFKEILNSRITAGYKYISLAELKKIIENHAEGKYATVTFDDVPHNFITTAYHILHELEIPFTLFITTSFLNDPNYLSKEDIIQLSKDPLCTIGAHTVTHPMLRKCTDPYTEIVQSKQELEQILGKPVNYLAYPYGRRTAVSHKIEKLAQKAGFKLAFGTIQTPISFRTSKRKFYLPRVIK